ncbi:hypothetical protein ACFS5J_06610 [Flavobacterium chuncheonense]|uniref:Peptidase M56 domain-containing protein n=1 Tax=Flavobacterium chuncheonense TaxID=2026653 RepID=A0ABW5YKS6_9FLAO
MIVLVLKYFVPKGFKGITLFPFVILFQNKDRFNEVLLNHEKIHIRQQLEMLILPFFIWYGIEFLIRLLQFNDRNVAYRNISFEKEAYVNEKDLGYLKQRPLWSFSKYI